MKKLYVDVMILGGAKFYYLMCKTFYYYNKELRHMYCSIGDAVIWRYCNN